MEELQVIETTSGRRFKPWASREDVQAIKQETVQAVEQAVQDPASVTGLVSEIASGKQAIASAINAKGGSASATESFAELAEAVEAIPVLTAANTEWEEGFEPTTLSEAIVTAQSHLVNLVDDVTESISISHFLTYFPRLGNLVFNRVTSVTGDYFLSGCKIKRLIMPLFTSGVAYSFRDIEIELLMDMPSLSIGVGALFSSCKLPKKINMPSLNTFPGQNFMGLSNGNNVEELVLGSIKDWHFANNLPSLPSLRKLVIGKDSINTRTSLPFDKWTALNVIDEGQSGIDELNTNIQTYVAPNLLLNANKTITFGSALYNVLTSDTFNAVAARGWNVASA